MADLQGRLSPSCLEEFEDETLDPRIQVELERLNGASEEINKLELELDDARASFRQTLSDTTHKLDAIARKLGSCVEKARPYYDARFRAKEVQVETQKAAYMYERACSMHEAAKEMVQVAEQGYMQREEIADSAWQEMLNHATMKVNEAEKDRLDSEAEHRKMTTKFKVAQDVVQKLQQELKRSINKSKPYFEMKAKFNQQMEDRKRAVNRLEEEVGSSKNMYSEALRNLEEISEEIHRQRLEQRNQAELGVRGAGVGSESPSPPPMRGSEPLSIDGKTIQFTSSCSTGNSQTTVTSSQSVDTVRSSRDIHLPSVIYSSPDKARTRSYRRAIESQQSRRSPESETSQTLDSVDESYRVNIEDEYMCLPGASSSVNNNNGGTDIDDVFQKQPPKDSDKKRKSFTENISHISEGYVGEVSANEAKAKTELKELSPVSSRGVSPVSSTSSEKAKKPAKLQGLILQIGPGSNPLSTQIRSPGRGSLARQNTEPLPHQRPASYPYSHNTPKLITPDESNEVSRREEKMESLKSPDSDISERRLLKAPSMQDFDAASMSEISDSESVTSGTMLDDEQVDFLTMDFSHQRIDSPSVSDRNQWCRMSLPTNLSHLENYIRQLSNERTANNTGLSPSEQTVDEDEKTFTDKSLSLSQKVGSEDSLNKLDENVDNSNIDEEAVTRL